MSEPLLVWANDRTPDKIKPALTRRDAETPSQAKLLRLDSPILTNEQLERIRALDKPAFKSRTFKTLFAVADGAEGMRRRLKELQADTDDDLSIYERDPSETTTDANGATVWANPAERAVAEAEYDLPTLEEVNKQ